MKVADIHFLVAEDHGFQRWLIASQLEQLGARSVSTVSDGASALEVLARRDRKVDVVISDLDMPGMDGMALIRHMSEHNHSAALIIVSAVEPAVLRSVEAMAIAYGVRFVAAIRKPLKSANLQEALGLLDHAIEGGRIPAAEFTRLEIEEALREAQFEPFFQPKVELKASRLCGAEALARWRHPTKGFILPDAFIGAAESSGLIDLVTHSIATAAVRGCRAWRDAGLDLTVSINVSSTSLCDTSFADWMTGLAKVEGLEPRRVICEVTETAAMRDLGRILETLSRLRLRGFGLSIDDFGTGYSSMERLSSIPFTELKIDQSFVKKAAEDPSSKAIVESSLDLAAKLDIPAVAEGVETQRQWEMLVRMGCAQGQGYYIARPMGAVQFLEWSRANPAGPPSIGAVSYL